MKINEIFLSLQGEGIYAGIPMVFVRTQGCNLYPDKLCKWCDTRYAQNKEERISMTPEVILNSVVKHLKPSSNNWVCITGGEPLSQIDELKKLVRLLKEESYNITVETNGTLPVPGWYKEVASWSVDYKCPSSGITTFDRSWLRVGDRGQLKFVVKDQEDLDVVRSTISGLFGSVAPVILVSPVIQLGSFGTTEEYTEPRVLTLKDSQEWIKTVWDFCVDNRLRFSLQLHKIVWGNKVGV